MPQMYPVTSCCCLIRLAVFLLPLLFSFSGQLRAQQAVPVGSGSYAEYPPEHEDIVDGQDVNMVTGFLNRELYIHASKTGEPVPSNDWWTDLIFSQYSGNMWAYPLTVSTNNTGLNVYFPIAFSPSGTDMITDYPIGVHGQAEIILGPNDTILADFEGGAWPSGWTTTGTAFGSAPAAGSLTGQSLVTNYSGSGLANSFHDGDGSTGTLVSPDFTVNAQYIHALVGGGNHPGDAEVRLVVGGNVVRTATGVNSENLAWSTWDVSALSGQTAHIEVVDNVTGGWGHILADQIVMTDDADPAVKFSTDFAPASAVALDWSDWLVQMRLEQNENAYYDVTMGHGLPFVWVESTGVSPLLAIDASAVFRDTSGNVVTLPYTGAALAVEVQGRVFGLHAPDGTVFSDANEDVLVTFSGTDTYLVISALPDAASLSAFDTYAYAIPRHTQMDWSYDPADGYVRTEWSVTAEALKGSATTVLQGWIPHHYRETTNDLTFTGDSYVTPRGKLKLSASNTAQIDFPFMGILPNLPVPSQLGGTHDYSPERMEYFLDNYATRTDYGGDTYWGGKSLTQFADYMTMAADLGSENETALQAVLTTALTDWLTYDGVEQEYYFARYDRYKALIGFNESYGSSQFTDNHFHYGYFTRSAALLGFQDPQFLADYGGMITLVAKEYANWDRTDTDFPFLRTFDIWHGHSYAGGTSAGNGNNQESSSESIQSWCGLFLLGEAMDDADMAAAGAMGYAIERLAIKEYWNDYHGNPNASNPVLGDGGVLPTEYGHDIGGIVFDSGPAFATFFNGDPGWIYGIQWLPIQPGLAYLGEDQAFAKAQMSSMILDRVPTMGSAARGVISVYNLAPARDDWYNGNIATEDGALDKFAGAIKLAYDHNPSYTAAETAANPLYINGQLCFTVEADGAITLDPAIWNETDLPSYPDLLPPATGVPLEGNWPLYDYLFTNYAYDEAYLKDLWEFDVLGYESGVDTEQAMKVIGAWGVGLGNVVLGYMAHYDPDLVAELLDGFYDAENPIGVGNDTSGLTYYYTHALRSLGHIVYDRYVDIPTSQVFYNPGTSVYSYAVYNPLDIEQTATVYAANGTVLGSFPVPPKKLVQHHLDQALDTLEITASDPARTITPGSDIQFTVTGYDQYGATHPLSSINWSADGGGTMGTNGLFSATTNTDPVTVTVTADGLEETYTFRVGDAPVLDSLAVTPAFLNVEESSTSTFSATGIDQYGDPYELTGLTWVVNGGGTINANGVFTSDGTLGTYTITATSGAVSTPATVVVNPPLQNVALGKTATATSEVTPAALALDGSGLNGTRWESQGESDDESFTVDLGSVYDLKRLVIIWEAAYASEYYIEISEDGITWQTVLTVEKGNANADDLELEGLARYVRFVGVSRGTAYGYSFYEFEVYGFGEGGTGSGGATTLTITPATINIAEGETADFDAAAYDENNNGGSTGLVNWTVDGGGTIDANGVFTSNGTSGTFTVTGTYTGSVAGGGTLATTATVNVSVTGGLSLINIAPNGTATASSEENGAVLAEYVNDACKGTRWASQPADAEQITIDFGVPTEIKGVDLYWETAYGSEYYIQLSDDGETWTDAVHVTDGDGGEDSHIVEATTRYVRMQGVTRGTPYAYSLWELEVLAEGTGGPSGIDYAEGRPSYAFSTEGGYVADQATDGDGSTRWASEYNDDDWIYVDLGQVISVERVILDWEASYGAQYILQVSEDAETWTDVYIEMAGDGCLDDITLTEPHNARYVRMQGLLRGTGWGYSLWAFEVYGGPPIPVDLTEGQTIVASSAQDPNDLNAGMANDGDSETRWASAESDTESIYVDLGSSKSISRVVLNWEYAYGLAYIIQVSDDGSTWTDVVTVTDGDGGLDELTFDTVTARYVRMQGVTRGTIYGYSLWDFEVYAFGGDTGGGEEPGPSGPTDVTLSGEYVEYVQLNLSPVSNDAEDHVIFQNTVIDDTVNYDIGTELTVNKHYVSLGNDYDLRIHAVDAEGDPIAGGEDLGFPFTVTVYEGLTLHLEKIKTSNGLDLAFGKTIVASSAQDPLYPSLANDGETTNESRWASIAGNDDDWIYVDLGQVYNFKRVLLLWETAYGLDYDIQVSDDADTWTTVYEVRGGNGQTDDLQIDATGRYVRMQGITRGTEYGYSLWSFEVYESEGYNPDDIIPDPYTAPEAPDPVGSFALQGPADSTMVTATRTPTLSWDAVTGATRYDVYMNITKDDYDFTQPGSLLDRYTKIGESTTTSFALTEPLPDRWTYKWYVVAVDGATDPRSDIHTFSVYQPTLEQVDDGIDIVNGCRDMNRNGTIEPFEDWTQSIDTRVDDLLSRMTLTEKVSQMFFAADDDPLSGFDFGPVDPSYEETTQLGNAATRLGIPSITTADTTHGYRTSFPTGSSFAAMQNYDLIRELGDMQRREMIAVGARGTLSPIAEVGTMALYPRIQEGCGEDADVAAAIIRSFLVGLQAGPEINPQSVWVTTKHWPGQGAGGERVMVYDGTTVHYHMRPWHAAIEAGTGGIMPGYGGAPLFGPSSNGAGDNPYIISYLRNNMGYDGLICSDWLDSWVWISAAQAGCDVMGGSDPSLRHDCDPGTPELEDFDTEVSPAIIDDRVRRILDMKFRLGLFENPYGDYLYGESEWRSHHNYDLAIQAARESMTLLTNDGILPLSLPAGSNIVVDGPFAETGSQWVIWTSFFHQTEGSRTPVQAIRERAAEAGINVFTAAELTTTPDLAVVVVGEASYTHGTAWAQDEPYLPAAQTAVIQGYLDQNIPVVVVYVMARPSVLGSPELDADALLLTYRAGDGGGPALAQILFGDYVPTGKTPWQLPRSMAQIGGKDQIDAVERWDLPFDLGATQAEIDAIVAHIAAGEPVPPIYGDPLFQYGSGLDNYGLTDASAPSAPALQVPADAATYGPDLPSFSWTASTDADTGIRGYDVYVDGVKVHSTTETSWDHRNLALTSSAHTWEVRAVNWAGGEQSSGTATFTLSDTTLPPVFALIAPTNNAIATAGTPLSFFWENIVDAGSGIEAYEFYYDGVKIGEVEPEALITDSSNIALHRPYVASSTNQGTYDAVTDGDLGTRWSSDNFSPQTLTIDLGADYLVNRVVLEWEDAYASEYRVETSIDGETWTELYYTATGDGDTDDLTNLSGIARYLNIYFIYTPTPYGHSLWEVEVYGDQLQSVTIPAPAAGSHTWSVRAVNGTGLARDASTTWTVDVQ